MATATAVPEQPQQQMSGFARVFGVFFSPSSTFADIVRKPSWIIPVIVMTITNVALSIVLVKHVDWVTVARQQIEKSSFASRAFEGLPEDQREAKYEQQANIQKTVRYVRGVVGPILLVLFAAALYMLAFNVLAGAGVRFITSMAIAAFAHLPLILKDLLGIPIAIMKDPSAINPDNFVLSNAAAILPSSAPVWQQILLGSLDVFTIWATILIAIGFAAANPRKLTFGKSLGIVIGVQVALILFFTGIAVAFS